MVKEIVCTEETPLGINGEIIDVTGYKEIAVIFNNVISNNDNAGIVVSDGNLTPIKTCKTVCSNGYVIFKNIGKAIAIQHSYLNPDYDQGSGLQVFVPKNTKGINEPSNEIKIKTTASAYYITGGTIEIFVRK